MRLALPERAANGREQQVDLALPPDEHVPEAGKAARTGERERTHDRMGDDAVRLALRLEHARFSELEGASRRRDRPLAGEHLPGSRALLEARADVHGIARDERPALRGPYDDLAGVDADAHRELVRRGARARRRCMARPACNARSAWSSSAAGAPKTAMTASPANFSTVPPVRSISAAIAS